MRSIRWDYHFILFSRVVLAVSALISPACADAGLEPVKFEPVTVEAIEEVTETFANDLLDLSVAVRDREMTRAAMYFASDIRGSLLPVQATELERQGRWLHTHGWMKHPIRQGKGQAEFMNTWSAFLDHFSEIEDVRFKVKASTVDSIGEGGPAGTTGLLADAPSSPGVPRRSDRDRLSARVYLYVVGRDTGGQREWAKAWTSVKAERLHGEPWRIHDFHLESLDSLVATVDLFSEVSDPAGVANFAPPLGSHYNQGIAWPGAAAGDVNGDGLIDIAIIVPSLQTNFLYLNQGNGRFRDVASDALLKHRPLGIAPLLLDYDNDGDLDMFMSAIGPQMLFENRQVPDGKLRFLDVSEPAGVGHYAIGFSAIAGDVNEDGYPDVYVTSYNRYGEIMPNSWDRATNGTPNLLFINGGNGTFREAARAWGVQDTRWSYAAELVDLDTDGDLDLYVANDFGENGFYINDGQRFVDRARHWNALDPGNGMGVSTGDFDNDGDLDLHVSNMSSTAGNRILKRLLPSEAGRDDSVVKKLASGNTLFENLGNGTFRDVTEKVGGFGAGWAWGGGFFDFDNDGWEDLYTTAGFVSGESMKDT